VKDQESLEPGTLVGELSDPVQHQVDDLSADGVMAAGVDVCRVFLAGDQLFRMEQLPVRAGADFVYTYTTTSTHVFKYTTTTNSPDSNVNSL